MDLPEYANAASSACLFSKAPESAVPRSCQIDFNDVIVSGVSLLHQSSYNESGERETIQQRQAVELIRSSVNCRLADEGRRASKTCNDALPCHTRQKDQSLPSTIPSLTSSHTIQ